MKLNTIKKNDDFVRVYNKGKSIVGVYVVMYSLKNDSDDFRIGITVSKKVGKAVVRNRVRRLIKETIVSNIGLFKPGYDYVFVARVRAKDKSFVDIEKNIRYVMHKFRNNIKTSKKKKA